jgi:CRP-like cAMP-binding protein
LLQSEQPYANRLLASLRPSDLIALKPHLEALSLPLGYVLYEHGEPITTIYFPEDCVISLVATLEDGTTPEMTTIGREGAAGTIALLGDWDAFGRYIVQVPGKAWSISLVRLQALFPKLPDIQRALLRHFQAVSAQTLQTVACNAAHPIEARCCRWILMTQDRVGRDELPLTHEFLAAMLGVQRPTVSIVARTLQTAGLIAQGRKLITIIDRNGLEEASCECYRQIRQMMERTLPRVRT